VLAVALVGEGLGADLVGVVGWMGWVGEEVMRGEAREEKAEEVTGDGVVGAGVWTAVRGLAGTGFWTTGVVAVLACVKKSKIKK
jgi:hypothetical protein